MERVGTTLHHPSRSSFSCLERQCLGWSAGVDLTRDEKIYLKSNVSASRDLGKGEKWEGRGERNRARRERTRGRGKKLDSARGLRKRVQEKKQSS